MRDQAGLSDDVWAAIDAAVRGAAERTLVGRRFIAVTGPLGPGAQIVPVDQTSAGGIGAISMSGEIEGGPIHEFDRRWAPLPIIARDFRLHWRDIEMARQTGTGLDTGSAQAAAVQVARAEDTLIVHGFVGEGLAIPGLVTVEGRTTVPLGDWKSGPGAAFENVVQATERLVLSGFGGPYALLCSPSLYAALLRVYPQTQILEIEQIRRLVSGGVYQTSVLLGDSAVLVASGAENMDLVIGQDLATGYLGPVDLNHDFRVLESVAFRIKRPGAICVFDGTTTQAGRGGGRRAGG